MRGVAPPRARAHKRIHVKGRYGYKEWQGNRSTAAKEMEEESSSSDEESSSYWRDDSFDIGSNLQPLDNDYDEWEFEDVTASSGEDVIACSSTDLDGSIQATLQANQTDELDLALPGLSSEGNVEDGSTSDHQTFEVTPVSSQSHITPNGGVGTDFAYPTPVSSTESPNVDSSPTETVHPQLVAAKRNSAHLDNGEAPAIKKLKLETGENLPAYVVAERGSPTIASQGGFESSLTTTSTAAGKDLISAGQYAASSGLKSERKPLPARSRRSFQGEAMFVELNRNCEIVSRTEFGDTLYLELENGEVAEVRIHSKMPARDLLAKTIATAGDSKSNEERQPVLMEISTTLKEMAKDAKPKKSGWLSTVIFKWVPKAAVGVSWLFKREVAAGLTVGWYIYQGDGVIAAWLKASTK